MVQTLIRGLYFLAEASIEENLKNVELGLNMNMCDALLNLNFYGQKEVLLSIDWGLRIAIEPKFENFSLLLDHEMTQKLQKLKNSLEQMSSQESVTLTQPVTFCFDDHEIAPEEFRCVKFTNLNEAPIACMRATLPLTEWESIQVLLDEKKSPELMGDFIKLANYWRLVRLSSVK